MTAITLTKRGAALHAHDDDGADALRRLSDGQDVLVEIKARRNIRRHRLAWKLASLVFENTDLFPSRECTMDAIKIGTGHVETWIDPYDGVIHPRPKSIAFHNMEEIDFAEFVSRAITLISTRWLVGVEHGALLRRVNEVLDGPLPRRAA